MFYFCFQNRIERIENLECCKNLTFLALSNNRIQTVENLTCLKKLLFLDLSDNRIKQVDVGKYLRESSLLTWTLNVIFSCLLTIDSVLICQQKHKMFSF